MTTTTAACRPCPPPDEDFPSGFIGRDFPLTDGGNAERFAAHHGEDVRHCHDWKKWLVWDGTRWGSDRRAAVEFRAFQTVRAIPSEAARAPTPKKQKALRAHATASDSASAMGAMLKMARSRPELTVIAEELDFDPLGIQLRERHRRSAYRSPSHPHARGQHHEGRT